MGSSVFQDRATQKIRNRWEELFANQKLTETRDEVKLIPLTVTDFEPNQLANHSSFLRESLLLNSTKQKIYFYDYQDIAPGSCKFRIELEQLDHRRMPVRKTILSTEKTRQYGSDDEGFLRVGLGNIDWLSIIENGDIQEYPTAAYFSKDQSCVFRNHSQGMTIESTLMAPLRSGNFGKAFKRLTFLTHVTVDRQHEKGQVIKVDTK